MKLSLAEYYLGYILAALWVIGVGALAWFVFGLPTEFLWSVVGGATASTIVSPLIAWYQNR